ncbi:MAG: tetraacyldisaccharide 4'-kinase [Gammaproteobacteria bacterium]|nr:tetraacyldisaccharide 4'-kinase [Gammaproteobacteria bacterium]
MTGIGLALPRLWRSRGPAVRLLLPLSWLYRGAARARRECYVRGLCRVQRFSAPVVVVGGITAGGSGKTPLVMHVARLLAGRGLSPGIVSRGYGGRSERMPLFVDAGTPALECGDEPAMMARNLDVPVVVDRDRPRGVRSLIDRKGCGVVISDDGLQHYAMDRQVEIVALGGEGSMGNGYGLPVGPLREPLTRLDDVDMVVSSSPASRPGWFAASLRIESLQRLNGAEQCPLEAFRGRRVHAAAGIGNPGGFFAMLAGAGIDVQPHPFPDHHRYGAGDFSGMRDAPIVMTEKDAVKCGGLPLEDAWYTRASIELESRFDNTLIELLKI